GVLEPWFDDRELGKSIHAAQILMFPMVAAGVGLFLGAAEGIISRNFPRALLCASVGFGMGFAGGLIALFPTGIVFSIMAQLAIEVGGKPAPGSVMPKGFGLFLLIVGRAMAWAIAAIPSGLGQGTALRERKLVWNGI